MGISVAGAVALSGCMAGNTSTPGGSTTALKKNVDGSVIYPHKDGKYTEYRYVKVKDKFRYGKTPTKAEMQAWHVDVLPDGEGLPEGHGSVAQGETLFNNQCAMCHGDFGAGGLGYPTLSGGDHSSLVNQMLTPNDSPPQKTIGTYWPYASTLFWYIDTGMPFPHPKHLTHDQVYALVAYLLSVNYIKINGKDLGEDYVLNRKRFLDIKMPNRNGFFPDVDDGKQGPLNMKNFLSHPENFGMGTTCMHNCGDAKKNLVKIKYAITTFVPPMNLAVDLPKSMRQKSFGEKEYNNACKVCHGNSNMGAPMLGDKAAWAKVLKQGMDKVYSNAIHGIRGMPPKGGTSLTDSQFKSVVDYLVKSSK